jgi:hypothetical protein
VARLFEYANHHRPDIPHMSRDQDAHPSLPPVSALMSLSIPESRRQLYSTIKLPRPERAGTVNRQRQRSTARATLVPYHAAAHSTTAYTHRKQVDVWDMRQYVVRDEEAGTQVLS